jgi:ribonuclease T2
MNRLLCLAAVIVAVTAGPSAAQVPLRGYFIALSDCAANKKKDSDNPGNVHLEVLRAYEMLGRNTTPGTHYQVKVPGAPVTEQRWVPMGCGAYAPQDSLVLADGGDTQPRPDDGDGSGGGGSGLKPDSIELVLAASWEPAFCATGAGQGKIECETQTRDRPDATQFSIHGLWPDDLEDARHFPCYCDRGGAQGCNSQPPDAAIDLSAAVRDELLVLMPGAHSGLELHEWPKHGSCYEDDESGADNNADPDEYFTETMMLVRALNDSAVKDLFVDHIGATLTRDQIEASLDQAFGAGAGARVFVDCQSADGDRMITELRINLQGDVSEPVDLASLILAAPPVSVSGTETGCESGRVVEVTAN